MLLDYQTVINNEHPTMADNCYGDMFKNCTSLTTAPELPATTLTDYCYYDMFRNSGLTTAPELPATILAEGCYNSMFFECRSLTTAPELPAITLANECYHNMFQTCTSLVTAPELPATTLANSCYSGMFCECVSLTTAPELPATTLAEDCYMDMFQMCTSLTTLPQLPAITLEDYCYATMFTNCSSLKLSTTQTNEYQYAYRIPIEGTGINATNALLNMFNNTGGTFKGAPSINTTYYTDHKWAGYDEWVKAHSLKFSSDEPFTLSISSPGWNGTLEYSSDDGETWTTWDGSSLSGTSTQPIYLRGSNNTVITYNGMAWSFTGKYCTGNIENLLDYQTVIDGQHPTLANGCYYNMFRGCTSLITAPELPATTLVSSCYEGMFRGCTSLITAPELPATTLAEWCYDGMFQDCTSLKISTTQTGEYQYPYRIPTSGTGTVASGALTDMFTNTGGTFTGAPEINTTYYTDHEPV